MKKTFKRIAAILLAVVMLLSAVPFASATPLEDEAVNPIYVYSYEAREFIDYSVTDNEATITGYKSMPYNTSSDYITIELPATINGYPVVAVGDNAFNDFLVDKLILPESITKIGNNVFSGASTLDVLVAPGVTEIGDFAFSNSYIRNFTLPESLQKIGKGAFSNCNYAEAFEISADNAYFTSENGILFNKDKTELIAYPPNKTDTTYTVPESVKTIAPYAFAGITETDALVEVIMTDVTAIGESAFSYACLESVTLGDSLVTIGDNALSHNRFTEITLPDTVRTIGAEAFESCVNLVEISIPEGVTRLENGVFDNTRKLQTLHLPSTLSYIGEYAVTEILLAKTVYFNGTLEGWLEIEKAENHGFNQQDMTFIFSDGSTHTHSIAYKDVTEATCNSYGSHVPYCTGCGEVYDREMISPLPHTPSDWVIVKPATIKENGQRKQYCTVCNSTLKTETVTELTPGVDDITYIKSLDTHNSFVVAVVGRASMVQFIEPDGGTRTYDRNNKNVKIVSYTRSGTTVDSLSRELSYELWEINTNLSANVEIRVRAKYYFVEEKAHRWDADIYKFTVQLGVAEPDAELYGLVVNNTGPKGPVTVRVLVGPDAEGVRFIMPNGTTTTYVKSRANVLANGHLEFIGKAWANEAGENKIIVQVKLDRAWYTVDNFIYYAAS